MTAMISAVMIAGHHDNMFHITLCLTAPSDTKGQIYGHDLFVRNVVQYLPQKAKSLKMQTAPPTVSAPQHILLLQLCIRRTDWPSWQMICYHRIRAAGTASKGCAAGEQTAPR